MVLKAWQMASNGFMGPTHSNRHRMAVSDMYTYHSFLEVSPIFGFSFSCEMPVTSELNRIRPPWWLSMGSMATVKRMIPIPPIRWVKLRQNRMPWGRASTLGIIEAPVVVSPETVSKKASATLRELGIKQKGNMPKRVKKSQMEVTIR